MTSQPTRKRKSDEAATTPTGSPAHKKLKITQSQKQALIDNLQLEVTERARNLRAHYALQCADLRARVERRINRIPGSLRKATIGELYAKHTAASQSRSNTPAQVQHMPEPQTKAASSTSHDLALPAVSQAFQKSSSPARVGTMPPPLNRGKKRKSEDLIIAEDKEDEPEPQTDLLAVSKNTKRAGPNPPPRQISRANQTTNVLSPRSHNSRTLPRSPIKDFNSPSKEKPSYIARPVSPLKPASPLKTAASAATSAISASFHGMVEHAKRGTAATAGKLTRTASKDKTNERPTSKGRMLPPPKSPAAPPAPERTVSQSSIHSTTSTSTSTTVVKKGGKTTTSIRSTAVRPISEPKTAKAAKTALKKSTAAVNKKVVLAEPAQGRRVLRKRN